MADDYAVRSVQTLDQLHRVWSFAAAILGLPAGKHTLEYYTEQFARSPQLLVFAASGERICGCILASVELDHVLIGAVAVAEDMRRRGIGAMMMGEVETQARQMGHHTLILGSLQEAEPFYLSCGFEPNLFIQCPESDGHCLERLIALGESHEIIWQAEQDGLSKLMLKTPEISRALEQKYIEHFPTCSTQYVFIKRLS